MAAISISIIGILLGPLFPTGLNHTARVLPRDLVGGTVGWISAFSAGANALISIMTGEMVSRLGIESLQPLCAFHPSSLRASFSRFTKFFRRILSMMIMFGTLWIFVPKKKTHVETIQNQESTPIYRDNIDDP